MEEVIFKTRYTHYQLHVAAEQKFQAGGEIVTIPAKLIPFNEMGEYRSSDPEEIALIRKTIKKKKMRGEVDVFEITEKDKTDLAIAEEALRIAKQRVTRGTITTDDLKGHDPQDLKPIEPPRKPSMQDRVLESARKIESKCPLCDKIIPNDPKGNRMKAHIRMKHKGEDGQTKSGEE